MQEPVKSKNYYFVDESGDPTFYNRNGTLIVGEEGCSKILIMGFIETQEPQAIRKELKLLRNDIVSDPYLTGIPSLAKTKIAFHAKDDCAEVRQAVFNKLTELDFKAQFVVARKIERAFRKRFDGKENKFYNRLISTLFENVLHRYEESSIYFAKRGSRNRQIPLEQAIKKSIESFELKWRTKVPSSIKVKVFAQLPSDEPCLQVIDYMNWVVYRAFIRSEMRYYKFIESKVSLLVDLYDVKNYPNNYYSKKNPFDCKNISPV